MARVWKQDRQEAKSFAQDEGGAHHTHMCSCFGRKPGSRGWGCHSKVMCNHNWMKLCSRSLMLNIIVWACRPTQFAPMKPSIPKVAQQTLQRSCSWNGLGCLVSPACAPRPRAAGTAPAVQRFPPAPPPCLAAAPQCCFPWPPSSRQPGAQQEQETSTACADSELSNSQECRCMEKQLANLLTA